RPDNPRCQRDEEGNPETDADGQPKAIKYETPSGGAMRLDVHPRLHLSVLDVAVPLLVTEGLRKADAAISIGLCCLALLGVWNWRRNGEPLPDWQQIPLNGR